MVVLVEEQPSPFELGEEGLDGAADSLELLVGDVLLLVAPAPESSCFYSVVEDCTLAETAGVAVEVGCLDGLEDRCAVVLLGHGPPPLEVSF